MFKFKKSAVAMAMASTSLFAQHSFAAGFALNDHSASASGNALAGAAASQRDISTTFWNPAHFVNTKDMNLYASGAIIIPNMDVTVNSAQDPAGNDMTAGSSSPGDVVDPSLVPSIYFALPVGENTVLGAAFNAPFALAGEYDDDWAGRYHSTGTSIQDLSLSFSAAHRINEYVAIGLSGQIHSIEVQLDAATTDFSAGQSSNGDGDASLKADDIAFGYALGVQVNPVEGTRIGLGYRSEVDILAEGKAKYKNTPPILKNALGVDNADIQSENTLPSVMSLGFEQDIGEKFTLGATAMYTKWSQTDSLVIVFDEGADNKTQPDSVLTFGFDDEWFYSLGLTYDHSEKLTFRGGIAVDNSPVKDQFRSARTPDGDRNWLSFGSTYDLSENSSLVASYTYVMIDDVTVDRKAQSDGGLEEDASRGSLNADYETNAHVLSVAYNVKF